MGRVEEIEAAIDSLPRKNTGASSNGFVYGKNGDGTTRSMPTPPRASSISFLTKRKVSPRKAFFVTGHRKSEIHRYPAVLGTFPGIAI